MAERLVPLPATQLARVRFLVPARPTFRVEKVALFCNLKDSIEGYLRL
jgi:hypothetical protein